MVLWQRASEQQLWGHLPLLFFLLLYGGISLGIEGRKGTSTPQWRWWLASTMSGLLLITGFPPLPFTFLLFVGWVPLLQTIAEIQASEQPKKGRWILWYGYHTAIIWNIGCTWWVANSHFIASLLAITLNSLFMALVWWLYHQAHKVLGPRLPLLALVVFWLAFEHGHMLWELTWPWLTLGNGLSEYAWLPQWYAWTGHLGGSAYIWFVNIAVWLAWRKWKTEPNWQVFLKPAAYFFLPLIISLTIYFSYQEKGKPINVTSVQPDFEPHYIKFDRPQELQLSDLLQWSREGIKEDTEYLIWPETSLDGINQGEWQSNEESVLIDSFLVKHPKVKLVAGIGSYQFFTPADAQRPAIRITQDGRSYYESYNAAVQVSKGMPPQFYLKSKFVPGAEIFPFRNVLFFLKPLVESLGGGLALGESPERYTFKSTTAQVAPIICYESVFGDYVTGYVRNHQAQALFIVTNDGWWDNTAGHVQHQLFARLRAIENRRDVVRSANMGNSCFINQRGDIVAELDYGKAGPLNGTIHLNNELTLFSKYGDLTGRIASFLALIFLFQIIARSINGGRKTK